MSDGLARYGARFKTVSTFARIVMADVLGTGREEVAVGPAEELEAITVTGIDTVYVVPVLADWIVNVIVFVVPIKDEGGSNVTWLLAEMVT